MIGAIVLVPYLYLAVPPWFAATLLGLGLFSVLQVTFEPVLPGRWTSWIASVVLLGGDVAAGLRFDAPSLPFLVISYIVLVIGVVGAANLWAPSGMKARDAAVLGGALTVYDFVATSLLSTTNELIDRLHFSRSLRCSFGRRAPVNGSVEGWAICCLRRCSHS